MNKFNTVTIGIPALNEEDNIGHLIKNLLSQDYSDIKLDTILVISDGSTDKTVSVAKAAGVNSVTVIERKVRKGAMNTQNEILGLSKSDYLIMLDADVLPIGKEFVQNILKPLKENSKVGIVGADTISMKGSNFFEEVIAQSHEFKKSIYKSINNGDNIYMCHGRARAFSKRFYSTLKWVEEGPEDAFSYLSCIDKGFEFKFAPDASVLFKSPSKYSDHAKQSVRFEHGKKNIEKYFDKKLLDNAYLIPKSLLIKKLITHTVHKPLESIAYVLIKIYIDKFASKKSVNLSTWEIATSSKKLK